MIQGRTNAIRLRIGQGWDTHALVTGRRLILGGVDIPHTHGLQGHSDADALCHAMIDALFGAAGLGDIGHHFPDTDERFRGADSLALLAETARRLRTAQWEINNIDSTVVAQAPKLAPYINTMRQRLSMALGVGIEQVNVKAKTAEKMGPVGRGEAIEAQAVCLLLGTRAPGFAQTGF
jgi:2-C-methyl-D-erythritol 2,4-cyclodiphosphate synthase